MKNLNNLFLIALLILISIGTYLIFKPFLIAIFMAFILSQLFKNWYNKMLLFLKKPAIASFATSLIIFLMLLVPLLIVTKLVASEIINTYQVIDSGDLKSSVLTLEANTLKIISSHNLPVKTTNPMELLQGVDVNNIIKQIGNVTTLIAKYIYQGTSQLVFTLFIMFFCLYYFFKDGERLIAKIINLSPLKNTQEKTLLKNFTDISRATLKGSLIIAIIQGILTTILFIVTGVSSAVLLGIIATLLALIPMFGTAVVWVPVGIIMLILGNIWQGITILLVGAFLIGIVDNLLRPQLVGNSTSLHPLLVFLSTLGGISLFGLTGFLLGPVIVVLFLNLLDIYKAEFKDDLKKFNN